MTELRAPRFDHLLRLTDATGVFEHARYSIPRRSHGYTVDDNARALRVVACSNDETLDRVARVALSLVSQSLDAQGRVRNRLSADGVWSQLVTSGDPLGRAWQGLGAAAENGPRWLAEAALDTVGRPGYVDPEPLRPSAFAGLGAAALLAVDPSIPSVHRMAARARRRLLDTPAQLGPVARAEVDLCQRPGPRSDDDLGARTGRRRALVSWPGAPGVACREGTPRWALDLQPGWWPGTQRSAPRIRPAADRGRGHGRRALAIALAATTNRCLEESI